MAFFYGCFKGSRVWGFRGLGFMGLGFFFCRGLGVLGV